MEVSRDSYVNQLWERRRNARLDFRQRDYGFIMENVIYNALCQGGWSVDVGMVEYNPVTLQLPSTWLPNDRPVNSTTHWHGGYFNCTYEDPLKEFLGEMGEPCEDCPSIEVTKGDKTVKLYNPEKVEFKKE